jgi:GTP cyclohydrolase I
MSLFQTMDLPMNALTLPDIAAQASRQALPLEWVGMCGIALPILSTTSA